MKTRLMFSMVALLVALSVSAVEQKDTKGCEDHPLFTRMPTYWIRSCEEKEFDSHGFFTAKGKKTDVEGRLWHLSYYPQADAKSKPSDLQIIRNYEAAVQKLNGKLLYAEKGRDTFVIARDGKEFWVEVGAEFTGKYGLWIVEKGAMAQDIVANAGVFSNDIRTTGHAAVYGIYFDSGKADIKPESAQAIGEIAKLLKGDPGLKIHVVGHTDNVGSVESNLKLSEQRAAAVMQALVRDHGVAAGRMRAFGCAQFSPVASNDAEEGRAKNRRVELVKQ